MSDLDLKPLHDVLYKLLNQLDEFCRANNIEYWIDAGTLLGYKRHGKIIPWDDDIDICMKRADYEKFITTYKGREGYELVTFDNNDKYKKINIPCKLMYTHSRVKETYDIEHNVTDVSFGIFLDIFPYDKYSNNYVVRRSQRLLSMLYKCKYASFTSMPSMLKKIMGTIGRILPIPLLYWAKNQQLRVMSFSNNGVYSAGIETPFHRAIFEEDEIFPLKEVDFNGFMVFAPNNIDVYLEKMFDKDYMSLPHESNRVCHIESYEILSRQ
ncbi:phosphorylcholine transferase LicD [Shewanella hanedai]|uniref:LicD family protein n=1 Tax=Shewanella hanedai TaxID=25 RepID=A0A553JMM3_SHEHA|nr:LicD family protein [Shewanella hanedai]TRY13683.1 LicD family protein [Shewanella hanedai]GGI98626.1 phosphorylcholine transferase LicD [Shewanella hanedai]